MIYLFLAMCVLSVLQPTYSRRIVALSYTIPAISIATFADFPDQYYFLYSALFEGTGIAWLLYSLKSLHGLLAQRLQKMCLMLVILQSFFYGCWLTHVNYIFGYAIETVYFNVWVAFYILICVILLNGATGGRTHKYFGVYSTYFSRG